ncbi:MAG: hypothetical protein GOU98_04365 [Candidatus Altiarchaeota archaeon]|nr:hypothetical protein [Candidatus Altiarchaeota archaeon]
MSKLKEMFEEFKGKTTSYLLGGSYESDVLAEFSKEHNVIIQLSSAKQDEEGLRTSKDYMVNENGLSDGYVDALSKVASNYHEILNGRVDGFENIQITNNHRAIYFRLGPFYEEGLRRFAAVLIPTEKSHDYLG